MMAPFQSPESWGTFDQLSVNQKLILMGGNIKHFYLCTSFYDKHKMGLFQLGLDSDIEPLKMIAIPGSAGSKLVPRFG